MTPAQLALFFVVLVLWMLYALALFPLVRGRRLRRELEIAGWVVIAGLLVISLIFTPSLLLWFEYAGIALLVFIGLLIYNRWAIHIYETGE